MELQEALTIIELQRGHIAALELQVSERDDSLREAHVEIALLRFEVALPSGRTLRFPESLPPDTLRLFLRAMEGP